VKVKHNNHAGLLQPLQILEWKWEIISMEFIIDFPKTIKKHDTIMVVVDKFRKGDYFIPIKSNFKDKDVANVFTKEIFRLHGLPKAIVSNREANFTSRLWKILFVGLGTKLEFSTTYHPQTYV
jgi:hypothetical protein